MLGKPHVMLSRRTEVVMEGRCQSLLSLHYLNMIFTGFNWSLWNSNHIRESDRNVHTWSNLLLSNRPQAYIYIFNNQSFAHILDANVDFKLNDRFQGWRVLFDGKAHPRHHFIHSIWAESDQSIFTFYFLFSNTHFGLPSAFWNLAIKIIITIMSCILSLPYR